MSDWYYEKEWETLLRRFEVHTDSGEAEDSDESFQEDYVEV